VARLVAERLARQWGQPVVVENRPGGDGIAAVSAFVAARDDHLLLLSPTAVVTVNPLLHQKLPYDPARDLVPISSTSNVFVAVAVPTTWGVRSLAELVERARAAPGRINWAATPGGSYLAFVNFLKTAGLSMVHIPYRDTNGAVQDLAEARIEIVVTSLAILMPQVRAGNVTLLAVTNRERASVVPAVPTAAEAGFLALTWDGLVGLFGQLHMAPALRERIASDVRAAIDDPQAVARLARSGTAMRAGTPAQFGEAIAAQREEMAAIVRSMGSSPH
jgi:tripartite-type tricarboxylate transporter receptor subunit TctC